jgi:tetratricopeptide (TPR) repeat protein
VVRETRIVVLGAILIALFAGLVTWNALDSPFILDDHAKIVQNTDLRRLEDLPEKLVSPYEGHQVLERNDPSRPLVFLLWTIVYHLAGLNPLPYHLANLIFHALAGVLVFLLARRALGLLRLEVGTWVPVAAGLFFVVTPIQVGTVIYAYALSDVLGGCLVLLALHLHAWRDPPGRLSVVLAAFFLALALLAKQAAVVAPLLFIAWDFCLPAQGRLTGLWPRWRPYLLYAAIAAAYVIFRLVYFGEIGDLEGRGHTYPPLEYAWAQPAAIWRYLVLSLFPWNLAIDHHVVPDTDPVFIKVLALGGLVWVAVVVVWIARKNGSAGRLALFSALFYAIAIAPTSSIVPTVDLVVERRVYLANFALLLLLAAAYGWLARRLEQGRGPARAVPVALLLVHLAALAAVSVSRNEVFRTNQTVWEDVLRIYPESPRALNNLANLYLEAGRYEEAREIYERLIRRDGRDYLALSNLGHFYDREGTPHHDPRRAASFFEAALRVKPEHATAHYNLARIHQKEGRAAEAERHYLEALRLNPNYVLAHNNLGLLNYHQGRIEEARRHLQEALRLDPDCRPALANLRLLEQGPLSGAPLRVEIPPSQVPAELLVRLYESALVREPGNLTVRRKFADLCRERGLPCAVKQYRKLLEADPANREIRRILEGLERTGGP